MKKLLFLSILLPISLFSMEPQTIDFNEEKIQNTVANAIKTGDNSNLQLLLDLGFDPNYSNASVRNFDPEKFKTPLSTALKMVKENPKIAKETVKLLLDKGANPTLLLIEFSMSKLIATQNNGYKFVDHLSLHYKENINNSGNYISPEAAEISILLQNSAKKYSSLTKQKID